MRSRIITTVLFVLVVQGCTGLSRDGGASSDEEKYGRPGADGAAGSMRRGLGGLNNQNPGDERPAAARGGRRMKLTLDDEFDPAGGGDGGGGGGAAPEGMVPVDFSVAKVESAFSAIGQSKDPLKLLFGLALLFYGRRWVAAMCRRRAHWMGVLELLSCMHACMPSQT
jgi:hypothetical protein